MKRTPVKSSNVVSIGHDPKTNTLTVEFNNGGVYEYKDVPTEKHKSLMEADSIGSHLHSVIKPHHEARKL